MRKASLRFVLLICVVILSSPLSFAQTNLPYYTGFDNTTQQNGWQQFREGYISIENWGMGTGGYSSPNMLWHDYPVGGSGTDTVKDWYVSPPFHFTGGGHIDSLRVRVFAINDSATAADHCGIYLLKDSPDPASATSIVLLADLTSAAANDTAWLKVSDIIIPPAAGSSYIGILYRATNDWFVPGFDNIYISADIPSAVNNDRVISHELTVSPNPAYDNVNVSLTGTNAGISEVDLYNAAWQNVLKQKNTTQAADVNVSQLPAGFYFMQAITNNKEIYNGKLLILK